MARITKIQPRPNSFRVDNIIIDEYSEKIGAIGVAIYNVLSRHADRETGICYPSIRLIARKLALGRTTVKKYLRILLNHSLIAISSRLSDEGDPTSNLYMLLDPSPEKVALRRRQLEALLRPQEDTFKLDPASDITDCKFSVAQRLRSSAQIEGDRIRREGALRKMRGTLSQRRTPICG